MIQTQQRPQPASAEKLGCGDQIVLQWDVETGASFSGLISQWMHVSPGRVHNFEAVGTLH